MRIEKPLRPDAVDEVDEVRVEKVDQLDVVRVARRYGRGLAGEGFAESVGAVSALQRKRKNDTDLAMMPQMREMDMDSDARRQVYVTEGEGMATT